MSFEEAIEKVLGHEGGYVNDPIDPGGETNWGISKRSYPHIDIKNLSRIEAINIYKSDYWLGGKCDKLPFHLRYAHFDACINMGIHGAVKALQNALGVKEDGILGSITLESSKTLTLDTYVFFRLYKYCQLVRKNQKLSKFIGGWSNRMKDIRNESL